MIDAQLIPKIQMVAPGTRLRRALDDIVMAEFGALVVFLDDIKAQENILQGGFYIGASFSPEKLYELAKMDGAIILDEAVSRILAANVQLAPDPAIPTDETGMRHRAAERVARQTRQLLARWGIVTRESLEAEIGAWSWARIYRQLVRMEMRGEVRRGYFVQGLPGVQFALPEAVGLLRRCAAEPGERRLQAISAADPLNLGGIITPGVKTVSRPGNRVLLLNGVPVAADDPAAASAPAGDAPAASVARIQPVPIPTTSPPNPASGGPHSPSAPPYRNCPARSTAALAAFSTSSATPSCRAWVSVRPAQATSGSV